MFLAAAAAMLLAATPELVEGRVKYSALSWSKAAELLAVAAADARNSKAERVEAYDLLARAHIASGNAALARAAYEALLELDPMAPDTQDSPKVRAAFREAKERRFGPRHVKLVRRPSNADVLEVEVINPWRLPLTYELEAQSAEAGRTVRTLEERDGRLMTALQPGSSNVLAARFADGVLAFSLGSPQQPLLGPDRPVAQLTPPPPAAPPPEEPVPAVVAAKSAWPGRRIASVVGLGVGGVFVLVGFGVAFLGIQDIDAGDGTPSRSVTEQMKYLEAGHNKLNAGIGLGIAGLVVLAASAVLLYLFTPDR